MMTDPHDGLIPPSHRGGWFPAGTLLRGFELVIPLGAAGGEDHVRTERPVDIVLEIGLHEREGAGEPYEVLLRDPQHDRIFERHDQPGAERRFEQHPLAEMLPRTEHALEMLSGHWIVDGEL